MVKFGRAPSGRAVATRFFCPFPEVPEGGAKKSSNRPLHPSRKTRFCNIAVNVKPVFFVFAQNDRLYIVSNENLEAWTERIKLNTLCLTKWRPVKLSKDVSGWAETCQAERRLVRLIGRCLAEQRRFRLNRDVSGWTETKPDTPRLLQQIGAAVQKNQAWRGLRFLPTNHFNYSLYSLLLNPYALDACKSCQWTFAANLNFTFIVKL